MMLRQCLHLLRITDKIPTGNGPQVFVEIFGVPLSLDSAALAGSWRGGGGLAGSCIKANVHCLREAATRKSGIRAHASYLA